MVAFLSTRALLPFLLASRVTGTVCSFAKAEAHATCLPAPKSSRTSLIWQDWHPNRMRSYSHSWSRFKIHPHFTVSNGELPSEHMPGRLTSLRLKKQISTGLGMRTPKAWEIVNSQEPTDGFYRTATKRCGCGDFDNDSRLE